MSDRPLALEVLLKEGPVLLRCLGGSGIDASYPLWNGISAREVFPPGTDEAFYILTLTKSVCHPHAVAQVEAELGSALQLLSAAWPFSGGSSMVLESRAVITSARLESNASGVRTELLGRTGPTPVQASATAAYEALATYRQPPLKPGSVIATAAVANYGLFKLLHYHQAAWVEYYYRKRAERASWFINLYKVRDALKKIYGSDGIAKARLRIPSSDWSFFGRMLNSNDLRHAEVTGVAPGISRPDVDRLYGLARTWTTAHLTTLRLPVV
jgi:hypothetical protein